MEGSMITEVKPSKSRTSIRTNHGQKPERSGEKADLLLLPDQERRSYSFSRAPPKETQSRLWTDRC